MPDDPVARLTVDQLHQALNDAGYICSRSRARSVLAALMTRPIGGFFAFGPPGTGKTWLLEVLGDILGMNTFFKQVSPGSREEDLILDLLPDETAQSGIKKQWGELPKAVRASHDGPTLLILDEWDKTRPTADAFLLDFLQNGRVNYGDIQMQADMDHLHVCITLNDERDLSGPAHRRMPYLHFDPLHPSLVRQALIDSHGDHPYIDAAVSLYVRCEVSMMEKSCTIQELQQLLDAISVLGPDDADWDALVLDYVTKDRDNHRLLKKAEDVDLSDWEGTAWEERDDAPLDPSAYNGLAPSDAPANGVPGAPDEAVSLPRMADVKGYHGPDGGGSPDLSTAFAALQRSDAVYDALTRQEPPSTSPDRFGRVHVHADTITFDEPVPLHRHNTYADDLWDHAGEIVFVEETATRADVRLLQERCGLEVISYSEDEIIGRFRRIHLRWDPDAGAEIIVPTANRSAFNDLFRGTWLSAQNGAGSGSELPTVVQARLGRPEAGVIEARRAGEDISDPYAGDVFDYWQRSEVDAADGSDIPGYAEFWDRAEREAATVCLQGDSGFALFDGLMLGFVGADNDQFAVSVTGPFDGTLASYLQDWLPDARLALSRQRPCAVDDTALIREHGFSVARPSEKRANPSKTLQRTRNHVRCLVRNGRMKVGTVLRWTQITGPNVEHVLREIDATVDALAAG